MKPQAGKRYVRADGKITDYLELRWEESEEYLYDKHHDAYYTINKDVRPTSEDLYPSELVVEYNGPDIPILLLEVGKRYVRADGEITGPLIEKEQGYLLQFKDEKHNVGYNKNGITMREEYNLVYEYLEPKTVKRWQWVAISREDGHPIIFGPATEQETVFVAVRQHGIILIGRIQESLIETEE